ncbi:MAG: DUF2378 family protein [Polyangiales bacterium]
MTTLLQLDATPREGLQWGRGEVAECEIEAFAAALPLGAADQRAIVATLSNFPSECQVRGMFFDGLVNVIKKERDADTAERLMLHAGVRARAIPFALLPHRDFYKLYFMAAAVLYPDLSLDRSMQRIAETFYPVFRDSMVGRTLSAMMGSDPRRILAKLVDAYSMSVQDNSHSVRVSEEHAMLWECRVEPSPFYGGTFRGIVLGTLHSHGVTGGKVDVVSRVADGPEHTRWVFRISW